MKHRVVLSLLNHGGHKCSKVSPALMISFIDSNHLFSTKLKREFPVLRDVYALQRFYGREFLANHQYNSPNRVVYWGAPILSSTFIGEMLLQITNTVIGEWGSYWERSIFPSI